MKTLVQEPTTSIGVDALPGRTLLFLHASADLYGSDRTLLQLCEGLRGDYRCVVALPRKGPLVQALESVGATVEIGELGVGARRDASLFGLLRLALALPFALRFVRRLAKRYRPVACHTNTLVVMGGALAARTLSIPHLWHVHEIVADSPRAARMLTRLADLCAGRVVCNSKATADALTQIRPKIAPKIQVIHNGTADLEEDVRGATALREEAGIPLHAPLVTLAGRINSWKGQRLLVEAAMLLHGRFPHARFLFVGDAPRGQERFERELDEAISAGGLDKVCHRLPFREGVGPVFTASDIVCVPSTRPEPFGLVALEAMSLSRSVVAADHGGLREIVSHGVSGALFQPDSPHALAEALAKRLANPALTRAEGRMGRAIAEERFSLSVYVEQFRAIYDQDCAKALLR